MTGVFYLQLDLEYFGFAQSLPIMKKADGENKSSSEETENKCSSGDTKSISLSRDTV